MRRRHLVIQLGECTLSSYVKERNLQTDLVDEIRTLSVRNTPPQLGAWLGLWLGVPDFHRIDGVICYAGNLNPKRWNYLTDPDIKQLTEANYIYPVLALLSFAMIRQGQKYPPDTVWIFTNSQSIFMGDDENPVYVGCKAGLLGFSRSLGYDLWEDVRVAVANVVLPLYRPSRMYDIWVKYIASQEGITSEEAEQKLLTRVKGRLASCDELADTLLNLLNLPSVTLANGCIDLKYARKSGLA